MPIVNTLAFLFTVIGEWWVEKKVISRRRFTNLKLCQWRLWANSRTETMAGMVLSISGIALCVHSKTS